MIDEIVKVTVKGENPYDVLIGMGLLGYLESMIGERAQRVAVIHPTALRETGEAIRVDLSGTYEAIAIEIPDAEEAKSAEVAQYAWKVLGDAGFTRTDVIVAVGGGTTTDLGGFVAATWLRGVRWVAIPTTLLGMVDAAVGGKTGINTTTGKNLVGAIHPPAGVLCDLAALETLPFNDLTAGLAEVIKCGFIVDTEILDIIEDESFVLQWDSPVLADLIRRAIQVKADVVAGDLREVISDTLGREVLNYGHTFGHAIERLERYQWRHGAAISVGMMYVAELARLAGRLSDDDVERHRRVLSKVGLPTTYVTGRWTQLLDAMKVDKKTRGDQLRFVILDGIGRPQLLVGPDPSLVFAAYEEVSA